MKGSKRILAGILSFLLSISAVAFTGCDDESCNHQWSDATCTLPKTCALCQATDGDALGHAPNADDGDCTTAVTCSVCGDVLTAAKTEHTGGEASCNHKAHCSVCNKEYGELGEHIWNAEAATEEHDKYCTVCGHVAEERLGHIHANHLTHVPAAAATCGAEGNTEYWSCSCGKWFSDSAATVEITDRGDVVVGRTDDHSHSTEWSENATQHWHECACGDKADVADHTWNADAATEEHDKHCTECGYVAEVQLGHTHQFATVLSHDEGGHYYASTCGHEDARKDYTPHEYKSAVTGQTCTEQGYTTYTCDCGRTYQDDYTSAADHSFETTLSYDSGGHWYEATCGHDVRTGYATHSYRGVVTKPTCTQQGYTTYTCVCGSTYVGDYVSETGHSVANWNEDASSLYEERSCKYAVNYAGTCSSCGELQQKTEYVEKHVWTYVVKEGHEATCQESGWKLQYCKNAGCQYHDTAKGEVSYSDPDAHTWVEDDEQSLVGMTSYHCTVGDCEAKKNTVSSSGTSANVPSGNVSSLDEVALNNAVIGFDAGIKNKLGESGSNVEISAGTLEGSERDTAISNAELTPEQEALLGDREIYNFTVTATENISELGGTATVRIPYTLSPGEDPDNIVVWYISNGALTAVPATYADGYVTFTTTHFSYYVATTIAPEQLCEYLKKHDPTNVHTVLPTCTEGGYSICLRCGKQIEGSWVEPLGHEWQTTVMEEHSCTANGVTKYECAVCGFHYETIVSATGHYYALEDQKNATCSQSGYATYGCVYCNSAYTVTLPQQSHRYVPKTVAPTCEERGYTEKTCLTCGDTLYTDYVDATGHSYGTAWHTNPSGHYHHCTVCGKNGEVTAHKPGAGATEHSAQICTVCEYVITPQLSHTHSLTRVEANEASCLDNGNIAYYTCACGKWFLDAGGEQLITDHSTVIVLAQGHTHEALAYVEPTCTEVGYTAGIQCSVCDTVLRGHVELPAYGHDYVTTERAPTCSAPGAVSKVCSACGDRLDDEVIPKLDHKYEVSGIQAPTCTEAGFTAYTCVYCGDSRTDARKDALGHSYAAAWSADENGHWHECSRCHEKSDEADHSPGAEATEHSPQLCTVCEFVLEPIRNHTHTAAQAIPAQAPTCSSMGNVAYYVCSCGEWYFDEECESVISDHRDIIIAASEHTLSPVAEEPPTCTEGGYSVGYYCTGCKRLISGRDPLPATGHDYVSGTCTDCGAEDPDYVPAPNTLEVVRRVTEEGTVLVQIRGRNVNFAGIRLRVSHRGYDFSEASCSERAQYFDDGSACHFVWSSGENEKAELLELLEIRLAVDPALSSELILEVVEIYEFAEDGELTVPDYEIVYK